MFIFQKTPLESRSFVLDLGSKLALGETIVSLGIPTSSTLTYNTFSFSIGLLATTLIYQASAGVNGLTVRNTVLATTSLGNVLEVSISLVISDEVESQYQNFNPDAFSTIIDKIEAGNSANSQVNFPLPSDADVSNPFCVWEMLDSSGVVYSSGTSFNTVVEVTNSSINTVKSYSVITVPSGVPSTINGTKYQIRYTLDCAGSKFYSFENFSVTGTHSIPVGTDDCIEIKGTDAVVTLVLDQAYDYVGYELYDEANTLIKPYTECNASARPTADGYYYKGDVVTATLNASLVPYMIIWKYWNGSTSIKNTESGRLFVVTAAIISAMSDVKTFLNRSKTTFDKLPETALTPQAIMVYLRMGMDAFNMYAYITNFNMTAASGAIREGFLLFSKIKACRSTYISLGGNGYAFEFSGQAISLNVDTPPYWDSIASALEGQLEPISKFKKQLTSLGVTGGDGNASNLGRRQVGAIALSISPVSHVGRRSPYRYGYNR